MAPRLCCGLGSVQAVERIDIDWPWGLQSRGLDRHFGMCVGASHQTGDRKNSAVARIAVTESIWDDRSMQSIDNASGCAKPVHPCAICMEVES